MTLKVGWYGDDFTGATDTLAVAAQANLRSLLFLDVPTRAQLAQAGALDAIGIAGSARTLSPRQMALELPRVGEFFKKMRVPVLHYKCCSTFDSSAQTGSLGAAIAVLREYVDTETAYVVGGQPGIGRFCCFSNLFAAAGADGEICRLDRHATMKKHPVTPMKEADLRRHLKRQGIQSVLPVHYPSYASSPDQLDGQVDGLLAALHSKRPGALLFDVARAADLAAVGRQLARRSHKESLLAVGPSSVIQALAAWWDRERQDSCLTEQAVAAVAADAPARGMPFPPAGQEPGNAAATPSAARRGSSTAGTEAVFVFAGSMSPVTAAQVSQADSYERIPLDSAELMAGSSYVRAQLGAIAALLDEGRHVLAYVAQSPLQGRGVAPADLARATAGFVRQVVERQARYAAPLRRIGVAGGDTSSMAAKALDIWALSFADVLAPGVTLCRAHSDDPHLNGLELMLKGGQMGSVDIFERLLAA
jgi:uncharacterized protein YgbK (DUF1537 family)